MKKWFVFLSKLLGIYLEYILKSNVHFSLQTSFVTLDEVIKTTNRRVNAIEHVIIPRYERTVRIRKNRRLLNEYFRSIIQSLSLTNPSAKNFSVSKKSKVIFQSYYFIFEDHTFREETANEGDLFIDLLNVQTDRQTDRQMFGMTLDLTRIFVSIFLVCFKHKNAPIIFSNILEP